MHSGAQTALSSLGRRVAPLSSQDFEAFEHERQAWPLPWNGHAQLACTLCWPATGSDPVIWFLSLPLDEQGLLIPAPRDAFLDRLLQTLGTPGNGASPQPVENLMQDNPLAFEPELHQRALLHARLSQQFGRPRSAHAEMARRYLLGDTAFNWQMIGLQGLADVVVRQDPELTAALCQRLPRLPREVLIPLCYLLEHGDATQALLVPLWQQLEPAREAQDLELYCALLRALLGSETPRVGEWLDDWLEDDDLMAADCLVAIAARGWHHLEHEARLWRFLDRLARCDQISFRRMIRDLALIPRLRLPLLMMLRQAPRDSAVGRRVAEWNI